MLTECCNKLIIVEIDPNFNLSDFINTNSYDKFNSRNLSHYSIRDLDPNEVLSVIKENKENILEKSCLEDNNIIKKIKKKSLEINESYNSILKYRYHKIQTSKPNTTNKITNEVINFKELPIDILRKLEYYYFKYEDWSKEFMKKISKKLNISLYRLYKWKIYKDI